MSQSYCFFPIDKKQGKFRYKVLVDWQKTLAQGLNGHIQVGYTK